MIKTARQQSGNAEVTAVTKAATEQDHLNRLHSRSLSFTGTLRWGICVLACAWIALCTAIGPIYRANASILDFSWHNLLLFICTFAVCFAGMVVLYLWARRAERRRREREHNGNETHRGPWNAEAPNERRPGSGLRIRIRIQALGVRMRNAADGHPRLHSFGHDAGRLIIRCTDRWWKIAIILCVGWLWAYATLLVAFGADVRAQVNEFNLWWANLHGIVLPYKQGFTQMDIYPTAHYLWPEQATYLTNQHNIVLTMVYGGIVAVCRAFSGSDDLGLVVLAGTQYLFAAFCLSVTAHRILTFGKPYRHQGNSMKAQAGALPRILILVFLLCCPLVVFSTISITKSPLFAFAFVWWLGIWYQLLRMRSDGMGGTEDERRRTAHDSGEGGRRMSTYRIPGRLTLAMAVSTVVMLISVKYALYIVAIQLLVFLIADRKRWRFYIISLAVPLVVFQVMISTLVGTGTIITGDPIESKGVQLQQIARVAQRNPQGIPEDARKALEPILDLQAMGQEYSPNDADRVKSSGTMGKITTYKWRTVTAHDMKAFNRAWLEIGLRNPVLYLDAFLAKSYGYFDVTDPPYVAMSYYVNNTYVQDSTVWIKGWSHDWRNSVVERSTAWGNTPFWGWFTHGNFWVVLTLVLLGAELLLRRWHSLAYQLPLLLLMGVMVVAPANNFERHMLPIAFSFVFIAIAFWQESQCGEKHRGEKQCGNSCSSDDHSPESNRLECRSRELSDHDVPDDDKLAS